MAVIVIIWIVRGHWGSLGGSLGVVAGISITRSSLQFKLTVFFYSNFRDMIVFYCF